MSTVQFATFNVNENLYGIDILRVREVLKHEPTEVLLIDIDEELVRAAAEYLPTVSAGAFDDPRLTLLFADASTALAPLGRTFDVIILDSNDAVGPAEVLFEEGFYAQLARSLARGGVCAVQAGSGRPWNPATADG